MRLSSHIDTVMINTYSLLIYIYILFAVEVGKIMLKATKLLPGLPLTPQTRQQSPAVTA